MKKDDSSDDDGFEEGGFEIKSFEEKNIPVSIVNDDKIEVKNDKPKGRINQKLLKSPSFEPTYVQTLFDRYGDKNRFTMIYRRYDMVQQDQMINFTCLFQSQFTIQELFKRKKRVMFDSSFESGNLCAVYQHKERLIFDILMHNDSNTKGYNQWFNFMIRQIKQRKFTIRIVNFLKPKSHFQNGMVPIVCASQSQDTQPTGVEVQNVTYYKNDLIRLWRSKEGQILTGSYYTLQFDLQLPNSLSEIYISMNYPYPLSRMQRLLAQIPYPIQNIASTPLGYSLGFITITNNASSKQKRKVFIQARQHPGETVSSFMMEGIVRYLSGNSTEAKWLRDQVEFTIVPMVNIDGVQMGNFRCNSTGQDLNRIWNKPDKNNHPEITKLKMMLMKMTDLDFFIDLHGHSKKMNTFLYGCRNEVDPVGCRVYPMIMDQLSKFFRFQDCTFSINKWKTKTARAIVFNNLPQDLMRNVFTIETSYFGYEKEGRNIQYTIADLHKIGEEIIKAIFVYYGGDQVHPSPEYQRINVQQIRKQLEQRGEEFQKQDLQRTDLSDSGSDSEPDVDQLDESEREQYQQAEQSNQIVNKKYSKSVSQPPRVLNRTSQNNTSKQREQRVTSIVSPKNIITFDPLNKRQQQPPKDNKDMGKDYFVKRQTNTDRTQGPSIVNNDQKDGVDVITSMQKQFSKTPNQIQTAMQQNPPNNNNDSSSPTALIAKQYFKLQGLKDLKTSDNGQFPILNQQKLVKPHNKSMLQNQKVMETFDMDKRESLLIPNLQKFVQIEKESQISQHYLFEANRGMRKSSDSTSKTLIQKNKTNIKQNQASQQDDPMISQLIRGIWAMNQQKYGQQLQQPKSIRYYQKVFEDEDLKLFDDKKLHENSRRMINRKSNMQARDSDFYS